MKAFDLRTLAKAGRWRTELDPSATEDTDRETRDWCTWIPAKRGFISVHSETELSAFCSLKRRFAALLAIPGHAAMKV